MGLLGKAIKSGVAMKVIEQARKPENQAKAKDLFNKVSKKKNPPEQPPQVR